MLAKSDTQFSFAIFLLNSVIFLLAAPLAWQVYSTFIINPMDTHSSISLSAFLKQDFIDAFATINGTGYRALERFIMTFIKAYLLPNTSLHFVICFSAALYGACAFLFYNLLRRFIASKWIAFSFCTLYCITPSLITANWEVLAFYQILIPSVLASIVLCLFRYSEVTTRLAKFSYIILLTFLLLIGPWLREYLLIAPFIVLAFTLIFAVARIIFIPLALIFIFHALYPTALIRFFFFDSLPIINVFHMGLISAHVSQSHHFTEWLSDLLQIKSRSVFTGLMAQFPLLAFLPQLAVVTPILVILFLLKILFGLREINIAIVLMIWMIFALVKQNIFIKNNQPIGWRKDFFLVICFLIAFAPSLRTYFMPVHLLYCLLFFYTLVGRVYALAWDYPLSSLYQRITHLFLGGCLLMAMVLGIQNVFTSAKVVNDTVNATRTVNQWVADYNNEQKLIISNIRSVLFPIRGLDHLAFVSIYDPDQRNFLPLFNQVLIQRSREKNLFVIQSQCWSIGNFSLNTKQVHTVKNFITTFSYLTADPLSAKIFHDSYPFLGTPDFENEFRCGQHISQNGLQVVLQTHLILQQVKL